MQKENILTRVELIKTTKSVRGIIRSLRKAEAWLFIAAIAAFLASAFFVVKYFVGGDMTPTAWDGEQWANACLGLGLTAVITAAQALLYASGYKGPAAIIATVVVVFFGLFSEISQSMEREDATVKHRSENSLVFQAALNGVSKLSAPQPIASPYAAQLADAEARLSDCKAKMAEGVYKNCDKSQGRVDSLRAQNQAAMAASTQAASSALPAAIAQAKALEYDEDKHYAMIRLIKDFLGVTGVWASFVFSLIIIGTFEYAFHFVGGYVADHRQALLELGHDPDELKDKASNIDFGSLPNVKAPLFVSRDTEIVAQDTTETQKSANEPVLASTSSVPSAVLIAVNNELRAHRINRIQKGKGTEKSPGQLFNFLRETFGGSNGDAEKLTQAVIDALAVEKIIIPNAQKQGRANAPDYVINYKHNLFLLNSDGSPRKDLTPQLQIVT
jgi:hypothetical protein